MSQVFDSNHRHEEMELHEPQVDARRGWWALTNMATFFRASDVDALLHLPGCTIDEADDEGNTPLHHARRGPRRPKPTNISDCWKEFHRNLGLAESVFDYRHQSLSIPPPRQLRSYEGSPRSRVTRRWSTVSRLSSGGKAGGSPFQPRRRCRGFHDVPQQTRKQEVVELDIVPSGSGDPQPMWGCTTPRMPRPRVNKPLFNDTSISGGQDPMASADQSIRVQCRHARQREVHLGQSNAVGSECLFGSRILCFFFWMPCH